MARPPTHGLRLRAVARLLSENLELRDAYAGLLAAMRLITSEPGTSILVTSTQPNEGKTTVASCLAITAALAGQRVLLIDGDLRRPWLAEAAEIPDGMGFAELLTGRTEAAATIHPVALPPDDYCQGAALCALAAGRQSPDFLPSVDRLKARKALQAVSQDFDLTLLDSPPILAVNDALLLASAVDGVLLVIGAGSADREEVRRAKEQLDAIGAPVFGAALNRFEPKLHGRPNQPYSGYYRRVRA